MMSFLIALTLASAPALPEQASPRAHEVVARVNTQGRVGVRIVRPYRLRAGKPETVPGAVRRDTQVRDAAGIDRPAVLIEFQ